jgi:tetratricopeptide (TPR) repeat protein
VILQNHDFKDAYVYIAINYIDLWKYQDAISYTDSILENDPEYENALFYKWKALKSMNNQWESIRNQWTSITNHWKAIYKSMLIS